MADITTGYVFTDGEKGVTATKMNNQVNQAVINPAFYSSKPSSSTLDPTDQLLELKGTGSYAVINGSQLITSVSAQVDATPQIYSVRLRSFNAAGNPNFECDQRNCGTAFAVTPSANGWACDRWWNWMAGTMRYSTQQLPLNNTVPGTNFFISQRIMRFSLTTTQAVLGATDLLTLGDSIEGPSLREMFNDVHSVSILCRSSVANLKFGLALADSGLTRCLTKLCTMAAANTWTLITLPNLPAFPAGGTFTFNPGAMGYQLMITLAAGSSYTSPANDVWQTTGSNFIGAVGQSNFASNAVNSTFDVAFVQHEPGPNCTTLIDKPFTQNYDECLRYYAHNFGYGTKPAVGLSRFQQIGTWATGTTVRSDVRFPKEMARVPNMSCYGVSAVANSVFIDAVGDFGVTGITAFQYGIQGITLASAPTGTIYAPAIGNYTADTGW